MQTILSKQASARTHTHTNTHPHTYARTPARTHARKLQALVYDILPPTTAIVDHYAIGLGKLSANEQLFDDAQTVVSL